MMNNSQLKERIRDLKDQYPLHVTIFKNDPQVIFLNTSMILSIIQNVFVFYYWGGGADTSANVCLSHRIQKEHRHRRTLVDISRQLQVIM